MRTADDVNNERSVALERVPAATRVVGVVHYVCPVGWSTKVYRLEGAAAAVWATVANGATMDEIAATLAVAVDDPFLVDAVRMLCENQLFRAAS